MNIRLNLIVILMLIAFTSCKKTTEAEKEQNNTPDTSFVDEHTSQNSLDWNGVYKGTLPCADCEGIQTKIQLNSDETYEKTMVYLGKDENEFKSQGKFSWKASGNEVTLEGEDQPNSYKVIENGIIALDIEGNTIEGELKEMYTLDKVLE